MMKIRLFSVALAVALALIFFPETPVSAEGSSTWVLVDTINPAGGTELLLDEGSGNKKGSFIKGSVNLAVGEMTWYSHVEMVDPETKEQLPPPRLD